MENFAQPVGGNYQPAANILQQIAKMRKQQGAQPDMQPNIPQESAPALQQPQQNKAGTLDTLHQLSQVFGYDPKTVFGYNLGTAVAKMPDQQEQPQGISGALGAISNDSSVGDALGKSSKIGEVLSSLFGG